MIQAIVLVRDHPVQKVYDDEEQVGVEGIPLAESTPALNPRAGHTVEEHHRLAGREEGVHHAPPPVPASGRENRVEGSPGDRVKSLAEVELGDDCRSVPFVTALHQLCGEEEVVGDVPPANEPDLQQRDRVDDERLQRGGKDIGHYLRGAILQADGAEVARGQSNIFLWQEDDIGAVCHLEGGIPRLEHSEEVRHSGFTVGQKALKKPGANPSGLVLLSALICQSTSLASSKVNNASRPPRLVTNSSSALRSADQEEAPSTPRMSE